MLPSLSKIIDRIIHRHIYSCLESKKLIFERNSGFGKNRSTFSSLIETKRKFPAAYDMGLYWRIVFMDCTKAFDRVIHSGLICELEQLGIDWSLLKLETIFVRKERNWNIMLQGNLHVNVLSSIKTLQKEINICFPWLMKKKNRLEIHLDQQGRIDLRESNDSKVISVRREKVIEHIKNPMANRRIPN